MSQAESSPGTMVVKSNELIQAQLDWSTLEHRITLHLISQIRKDDSEFRYQTVRIKDINEMTGTNSQALYTRAVDLCDSLIEQKVRIRRESPSGERKYTVFNLLSACEYIEGSGEIKARFNADMKPLLLELRERFTRYRLQFAMRLRSVYAIRFYELMKMREDLKVMRLSVEKLREMLAVEDKYPRFTDLKRNVIEPARREIHRACDVYFTYKVERDGRTPVRLLLFFHPNEEVLESADTKIQPSKREEVERTAYVDKTQQKGPTNLFSEEEKRKPLRLDARALFLQDLSQDDLNSLPQKKVDAWYREATRKINKSESGPDSYKAGKVLQEMHKRWEAHRKG
ncbi:MAG: RepB family plasmid replication initiator protein [Bacteroidetes bacterium]|jgi:plasmid replication initiation protein|nr:RepB family plasmid replication initiator protein [Bacteroidota bacterium]